MPTTEDYQAEDEVRLSGVVHAVETSHERINAYVLSENHESAWHELAKLSAFLVEALR